MSKEKSGNWFARHKVITVILVVIALAVVSSAMSGDKGDTSSQSPQQTSSESSADTEKTEAKKDEAKKERLTLDKGWKLDKSNPYMTQVSGTVSNNSDSEISGYIQITFSAYDADGANVGDCLDNANTVDANGKWKFKAMCSGENISEVKFKGLTGF